LSEEWEQHKDRGRGKGSTQRPKHTQDLQQVDEYTATRLSNLTMRLRVGILTLPQGNVKRG